MEDRAGPAAEPARAPVERAPGRHAPTPGLATRQRLRGLLACALVYLLALGAAVGTVALVPAWHPLWVIGLADLVATGVVFAASVAFNNSSLYDPYWSVAPLPIGLFFLLELGVDAGEPRLRMLAVLTLVALWGARLTWNWARGWRGLGHEDWRYVDIRRRSGVWYWPVSLLGIHLMPTAVVFTGCLALYAVAAGTAPLGWLDGLAAAVTLGAIALEAVADQQLRRFVCAGPPVEAILDRGLWAWLRHPNYAGEILFWCGLFLFALGADPDAWWTGVGPLAMVLLFVAVSIPMIDRRMRARRPGYTAHMRRVPALLPRLRGR